MENQELIRVKDVSMNYGQGKQDAVEHATMDVRSREIIALVGTNGSGKSTLMKGILGLEPITCGEIEKKRGIKIAYLPQIHTSEHEFPATVREIVLSGTRETRFSPFYTSAQRTKAQKAMEMLGVEDLKNHSIASLSGGQIQRVLLARAVAGDPDLLILDEPCSALDPMITHKLFELFTRLRDENGVSILIATHDWHFVREHADRVLVLNRSVEYFGDIGGWNGLEEEHTCHH